MENFVLFGFRPFLCVGLSSFCACPKCTNRDRTATSYILAFLRENGMAGMAFILDLDLHALENGALTIGSVDV